MLNIFKFKKSHKRIIFVIGSGRTGTHLLGRTLASSSEIYSLIEDERFFNNISNLVARNSSDKVAFKNVILNYISIFNSIKEKNILDKTHPNIWYVEDLVKHFPNAKFIGIKRNIYASVSSMLMHKGVLEWYKKIQLDEVNPFLGITNDNKKEFKELAIESKCTYRLLSHYRRMDELKNKFPEKILIVNYEDFYNTPEMVISELKSFLKLETNLNIEKLNVDGKDKWQQNLTKTQIDNISNILNA